MVGSSVEGSVGARGCGFNATRVSEAASGALCLSRHVGWLHQTLDYRLHPGKTDLFSASYTCFFFFI